MMDDKTLLNIALISTFIGIIALLIMAYYDYIPEKSFNDITGKDISSRVKIGGTINATYMHNNSMTIKLEQKCLMDVFLYDINPEFTVGKNVSVEGTVQEYNGKMEIMAEKITVR
jgi:RecG-like helicase